MKRGNARLIRSSLFWSAVVLRTEISRNYRSSPDLREGEGIIFLQERGRLLFNQIQLKSDLPQTKEILYSIHFLFRLRLRAETKISIIFKFVGVKMATVGHARPTSWFSQKIVDPLLQILQRFFLSLHIWISEYFISLGALRFVG